MTGWRPQLAITLLTAVVVGGLLVAGLSLSRDGDVTASPSGEEPGAATGATCTDPAGDVRDVSRDRTVSDPVAGVDLRGVALAADGERLSVRLTANGPFPADAGELAPDVALPVQWVLWLMNGEDVVYQLRAVLRAEGWEVVRDDLRTPAVVSDEPPVIDGAELGYEVALADLPNLPEAFGWVTVTTYGDPPVQDVCPDAASDSLAPDVQLRFPADS